MDGLSAAALAADDQAVSPTPDDPRVGRAVAYMRERLGHPLTVPELAGQALLSPYHFLRVVKRQTGRTPYRYLTMLRMREAKRLLGAGETVTAVAARCGYSSTAHFSAAFRRRPGCGPPAGSGVEVAGRRPDALGGSCRAEYSAGPHPVQ
ncbi:AraC family transcriptional regulator [Micromonospora sp. WMMD961]|uniref:helix-turn-helix domain-containing protein n=1 Tax=Micromonospora sp. WMMD961 TaxID=3016100 RepID=UPI0024174CDE|nr:AraC family transcriptional regulator [Micromonospora sp. WMMD961]MDG4782446.1 AraC family transcriptional regulator [Micromonospora sp. WMMD961]